MEKYYLQALTLCHQCWEVSVDTECFQTCANQYLIYKKGQSMMDNRYQQCEQKCNNTECIQNCKSEKNKNEQSYDPLNFIIEFTYLMQQANPNNQIINLQPQGNNIQQQQITNCPHTITRPANVNDLTKTQKLNKYEKLKKTFGTQHPNIQVPINLIQIDNKSYYVEHKFDCDVEQLIKIDAFNLDAFPKFIYGMFSALNQLHQVGIKHGNIDTFSIGYYSKRDIYHQQFVLMDFNLIDKGRLKNLRFEESIFQDYYDLGIVFLNILLKQQQIPNINHDDLLQRLKQSKELNKYHELIQTMLTNKIINPQSYLDQFNDNLRPQPIVDQEKLEKYQSQVQLSNRNFNINGYRHTNPANIPLLLQKFNNQMDRQSLPNNLQLFNNQNNRFQPQVIQQAPQQLQLMNSPQSIRQQTNQINLQQVNLNAPRQIQTISNPQIQSSQPLPQQPFFRQVDGLSNPSVGPLRLQRQQGQ
ncbi:hypothetical protein pb186bvf_016812 [Paramecium bursaria]